MADGSVLSWLRRPAPTVEVAGRLLPLEIRRLAHARQLTLRLAPDGSAVKVSMPRWGRTAEAVDFARSRGAWLAGQLARVPGPVTVADGLVFAFRGAATALRHDPGARRRPVLADGVLTIGGPAQGLHARLTRWLQAEARTLLTTDLAFYCARAGEAIRPLTLSSARARWGSCSSRGAIRNNWRQIMAPDAVRRSVVAHEVAHLAHFDHSPAFHGALAALFEGDLPAADRWLKAHGRSLHAPFG